MDNKQHRLKKLTELDLNQKSMDSSFMLFPLRVETKFKKKYIEKINEPDRILNVFKELEHLIHSLTQGGCSISNSRKVENHIHELKERLESVDIAYKEDLPIIKDLINRISPKILTYGENMYSLWREVIVAAERIQTLNTMKSNRSTRFVQEMDRVTSRMKAIATCPPFAGYKRKYLNSDYSQTVVFKSSIKHLVECGKFLNSIEDRLDKIISLTQKQREKVKRCLAVWDELLIEEGNNFKLDNYWFLGESSLDKLGSYSEMKARYQKIVRKLNKNLKRSSEILRSYMENNEEGKISYRYTILAGVLLRRLLSQNFYVSDKEIEKVKVLAANTLFDVRSEKNWMKSLLSSANELVQDRFYNVSFTQTSKYYLKNKIRRKCKKKCLCVRIFPDEISVTQTMKGLSKPEYELGRDFWLKYIFNKDNDPDIKEVLWNSLCGLYPPYRAAWIIKKTFPKDSYDNICAKASSCHEMKKSEEEFINEVTENYLNVFPTTYVDSNENVFDVAYTELLPERFVLQAVLRTNSCNTLTIPQYGHRLPEKLQLGLDLNNLDKTVCVENDKARLLGDLRWMTDYNAAERMGMAITMNLERYKFCRGENSPGKRLFDFESLVITGVKRAPVDQCEKIIFDMLESHLYGDEGLDLLKVGTPTNIMTGNEENIFDTSDETLKKRYETQIDNCVNPKPVVENDDLSLLKEVFNLKESVLSNVVDSRSRDIRTSQLVNEAMIDLLGDNKLISLFRHSVLGDFLKKDVLPRGAFPSLRIGSQPYGVLPICDFKYLRFGRGNAMSILQEILMMLSSHWNIMAENQVVYDGSSSKESDEEYLKVMGNTPISSFFFSREEVKDKEKSCCINSDYFRGLRSGDNQIRDLYSLLKPYFPRIEKEELKSYLLDFDYTPVIDGVDFKDNRVAPASMDWENIVSQVRDYSIELKDVPDSDLRDMVIEFFDLFSYRLDAWLVGLLHNKLSKRIKERKHSVGIGCFGWVFNLKEKDEDDFSQRGGKGEYILSPSIDHATTAAVLRSAYLNSLKDNDCNYDMSVNLSSERTRHAIRIIEGVKNGLSVGEILGADLERYIHEAYKEYSLELDECIYPLRKKYPLVIASDNGSTEDKYSITVLNGASLIADFRQSQTEWVNNNKDIFANYSSEKMNCLTKFIDAIDDEYDALTDIILSEGVYKLVQGNVAAVDALTHCTQEQKNIPMPEVTEIPISSAQLDNFLVAALPTDASYEGSSVYSKVEPKVEKWLCQVLSCIGDINIMLKGSSSNETVFEEKKILDLGISASDLVYLSDDAESFRKFIEISAWLGSPQDKNKFNSGKYLSCEDDHDDEMSFLNMSMAIDSLRKLLTHARALKKEDLVKQTGMEGETLYTSLQDKFDFVRDYVASLVDDLSDVISHTSQVQVISSNTYNYSSVSNMEMYDIIKLLLKVYRLGVSTALDAVSPDVLIDSLTLSSDKERYMERIEKQQSLLSSVSLSMNMLNDRLIKVNEELETKAENERDFEFYTDLIHMLIPSDILVVPTFCLDGNVPSGILKKQIEKKNYFTNLNGMSVEETVLDLSKVNETMMNLHQFRMFTKCRFLDVPSITPLQICSPEAPDGVGDDSQFVFVEDDQPEWLGAEVSCEDMVKDAYVYMLLNSENVLNQAHGKDIVVAGAMFDHWTERIPYAEQTAGLAFHCDQPDAEAPQSILLAVSTKDNGSMWSENLLLRTIKSAVHMAKCRAVTPEQIAKRAWTSGVFPLLSYELKK